MVLPYPFRHSAYRVASTFSCRDARVFLLPYCFDVPLSLEAECRNRTRRQGAE